MRTRGSSAAFAAGTYPRSRPPAGGSSSGLLATFSAQNASDLDLARSPQPPSSIASIGPITVDAGQKIIVHESVGYVNESDLDSTVETIFQVDGTAVDTISDTIVSGTSRSVARTFEITVAPGSHTFTMAGLAIGGTPVLVAGPSGGQIAKGQLTIELVNV